MRGPWNLPGPRRLPGALMLAASLSACTRWQVQSVPPQQVIETRHPKEIRVTRADGAKLVLGVPQIVRDTLYGMGRVQATDETNERVALADVRQVAIRQSNPGATVALVGGVAALAALGIVAAVTATSGIGY